MDIQKKLEQVLLVLKKTPIELLFGVCAFLWYMLSEHTDVFIIRDFWQIFILGEIFIYSCNYISRSKTSYAILYFASPILFGGLLWLDLDLVSLNSSLIFAILLFSYNWLIDNRKYALNALNVVMSLVIAILLSLSIFLIVIGTYYSITSIFGLKVNHDFYENTGALCYFVMAPFFFLFLRLQQKGNLEIVDISKSNPISIFINYILSPAIVIYTAILYIYLCHIIVLWTLPKGALASMVFALNISVLVAELIRSSLPRKILLINIYFRYFHIYVVPLLFLFWIAVYQRISYYSFTENRIYLILAGIAMTWFIFSHYRKQTSKFLYLAIITASLFILTTFIPGITAKDIADRLYQPTEYSSAPKVKALDLRLYPKGEVSIEGMNKYYAQINNTIKDSIMTVRDGNDNDSPIFSINIKKHIEQKIKEYNIDLKEDVDLDRLYESKNILDKNFGRIEIGSDTIIIFTRIHLKFPDSSKDDYEVHRFDIDAVLTK